MKKIGLFGLSGVALLLFPTIAFAQYYYPYHDFDGDVVCVPEQQTVREGERAYFVAYGGDGDYDWVADNRTYRDEERRFSHEFDDEGRERVTVRSDGESDTCYVEVVDSRDYFYYAAPAAPVFTQPTLTTTFIPKGLPNTGFPPLTSATVAFAAVLLIAAGLAVTPYAKKITAALR